MKFAQLPQIIFLFHLIMINGFVPVISSKILVLGEAGGGSHYLILQGIGEALARRGHNVTLFVSDMYERERESPLLNFMIYNSLVTVEEWENLLSNITASYLSGEDLLSRLQSQFTAAPIVFKLMRDQCHSALVNEEHLDTLRREKFDILIGDFYFICASLVGKALNLPYVLIDSPLPISWHSSIYYNPINPSYIPTIDTGYDSHMTFKQRLLNTFQVLLDSMFSKIILADYDQLMKIHNIRPDVSALTILGQAEIWFLNTHFALDFPRPLMPNSIPVGGITTGPATSLDKDLESFMQGADDGVIIFSLGGYVSIVTQDMADMFATAFSQLRQRVVWKQRGKTPSFIPANVKQMEYIPQNDLLGHPKTKLLVYHCGINGAFEALYHGVPVLCLPVFYDQKDIAQRLVSKGIGLRLHIDTLTSEELLEAIGTIIEDENFKRNMAKMSSIFRDEPKHPADRAADWVEYVIRHGGAGHLRTAAQDLNFFQYHLIDVFAFVFGCMIALVLLLIMCCRCLTRMVQRKCCARKPKQE